MAILPVASAKCGWAAEATESGRMRIPAEPMSDNRWHRERSDKGVNQSSSEPVGLSLRADSEKLVVPL